MDGHLQCRCLRIKAWGKAHQAEFGSQALFPGDGELPSMMRPWYIRNKGKAGKQQTTSPSPTNKSQDGGSREQLATSGKAALLLPARTAGTVATPSPPACPAGHAQPGRSTPSRADLDITLAQGLCRLVLSLAVKMRMQRMWGKQGQSSSLTASPTLALLCACLVRVQGQGFQWRGR